MSHPGHRVLVVDDDEEVRELLKDALEPMDCEIVTSPDGADGLARWNEGGFDLLITDLLVPRLDGLRLAETIRAKSPNAKILVITAVSHSLESELDTAPINGWLPKPLNISKLKGRVRDLLNG